MNSSVGSSRSSTPVSLHIVLEAMLLWARTCPNFSNEVAEQRRRMSFFVALMKAKRGLMVAGEQEPGEEMMHPPGGWDERREGRDDGAEGGEEGGWRE